MANSMEHWNGHQIAAIDIETTGLDPNWHEIFELAILPLDAGFNVRKDVMPLNILIKPEHPERIDWGAPVMGGNRKRVEEALTSGFDVEQAKDLLHQWWKKLGLPLTRGGVYQCKVHPLGQNFGFDKAFLKAWLGQDWYGEMFTPFDRDTMTAALFCNDLAGFSAEKVPFPKVNLSYLGSQLGLKRDRAHEAIADCLLTAQVYQRMMRRGVMA